MQSERHSREDWYRAVRHRNLVPKARLCHWRSFTPEASRRHVLNVYGVVVVEFFYFFLRECGFYRFETNRRSTTTNNKHKYRKQSEIKSQNQESGSKTRGFDLSSSSSSLPFAVASHVPLDDW